MSLAQLHFDVISQISLIVSSWSFFFSGHY